MGVFQDIELEWEDRVYTIKSHRVMGAIYRIEDIITLQEFQKYAVKGTAPIGKLCGAYGAVLRYAGANVKDEDVYDLVFKGDGAAEEVTAAILNLISMMLPPHAREQLESYDPSTDGVEVVASGNRKAAASSSPKRRTRPRSRKQNG